MRIATHATLKDAAPSSGNIRLQLENCTNCHEPHGTVNDRLLKVSDPRLCTGCHMATNIRPLRAAPTSVFFFNRSGTNCHSQIHGSNHPSGKFFMR